MGTLDCGCNTELCINPLTYLLEEIVAINTGITGVIDVNSVINPGILLRDSKKFCCPDCSTKDGFYFIGTMTVFKTITDALNMSGSSKEKKYPCCVNTHIGSDDLITWNTNFKDDKLPCCESTGFNESIKSFSKLKEQRVNLVEASTFNGISGLAIIDLFLTNSTLTTAQKLQILTMIENGIVVKCFECDIFIYNATTFINRLSDFNLP